MVDSESDDDDFFLRLGELVGMARKQRDVDRVFLKMVQAPYRGKVPFNHLANMDPDDFTASESHVEIIRWFRSYPSKFILFETDNHRIAVVGVRIPGVKMCLQYLAGSDSNGCKDQDCYRFHVCRKFIGGYCSQGALCPHDHHFQSTHNRQLLQKMKLDTFGDDDIRTIFAVSHLRVCDIHNQTNGHCTYNDRCTRIHLCENYVRGTCTDGSCLLGHRVDSSDHSRRLLGLYALDDKQEAEVVTNLLISRRKPDGAGGGMGYSGGARVTNAGNDFEDVFKFLQMLRPHSKKEDKSESSACSASVSMPRPTVTGSSLQGSSNAPLTREEMREQRLKKLMPQSAAESGDSSKLETSADADLGSSSAAATQSVFQAPPAVAANVQFGLDDDDDGDDKSDGECPAVACKDDDDDDVGSAAAAAAGSTMQPVWKVEVFGAWRDLTSRESCRLETQFCDVKNDNASIPIVLEEIGHRSTLTVNFESMLASLKYDVQLEALEGIKVKRDGGSGVQWTWYWQGDDDTWHAYSPRENGQLESAQQKKSPKHMFMVKKILYEVNLKNMMQKNKNSGRMRRVRRRPNVINT